MSKLVYNAPVSERIEAITAEVLADSVTGSYTTPDLTEEELLW